MPLLRTVRYSKLVPTPSGIQTLGLFDKNHHFIEYRVCMPRDDGTLECPRLANEPEKRMEYAKRLGIYDSVYKSV